MTARVVASLALCLLPVAALAATDCFSCAQCEGGSEASPLECCASTQVCTTKDGAPYCRFDAASLQQGGANATATPTPYWWPREPGSDNNSNNKATGGGLPECLCQKGSGFKGCTIPCSCAEGAARCDFSGTCTCEGVRCDKGWLVGCNATGQAPRCHCWSGWAGEECADCEPQRFGPQCAPCPACEDTDHVCDDGVAGTGECVCPGCGRTNAGTIAMGALCAALAVTAGLAGRQFRVAAALPKSENLSANRPVYLFILMATAFRALVLLCDVLVNTPPSYDTVMQIVMDVPGLLVVCMEVVLLAQLFAVIENRKRRDPCSVMQRAAPRSERSALSSRSLLGARAAALQDTISHASVVARVQEALFGLVFAILVLLLVCIPVLLKDTQGDSYVTTARLAVWCCLYFVLACLFLAAAWAARPHPGISEVFWTRRRLVRVCLTCVAACAVRTGFLVGIVFFQFKDLTRPSLPLADTLYHVGYYGLGEVAPCLVLLSLLRVRAVRYSTYVGDNTSCFISADLVEIGRPLSTGSTGVVYRGRLVELDVACKEQRVHDLNSLNDVVREAMLLVQLSHPRVVTFYGISLQHPHCYLVTELCDRSLQDVIDDGSMALVDRQRIALQISEGMAYIHAKEFVHRDLKPSNILLSQGEVKICDLGTATMLKQSSMTSRLGTPAFMAPEMFVVGEHAVYTNRVDVFSFGIILWSLVTCEEPYKDLPTSNVWDLVRRVERGLRPDPRDCIPPALWELMQACWHATPSKRPDFDQVTKWLQRVFEAEPAAMADAPPPPPPHARPCPAAEAGSKRGGGGGGGDKGAAGNKYGAVGSS